MSNIIKKRLNNRLFKISLGVIHVNKEKQFDYCVNFDCNIHLFCKLRNNSCECKQLSIK